MQITLDEGYNAMCDFVYLGYVGEVNARQISVLNYAIPEATAYKLKIEYPDKTVYEIPIKNGMCSLGASIFKTACEVKCQIVAYAVEGEVYKLVRKSDIFKQEIRSSIDESGIPSYEESLDALDKVLQYESNSKEYAERAEAAAVKSEKSESKSTLSALNASNSEQAAKTSEENAKLSESNSKASESNAKQSELNAKSSEEVAKQHSAYAKTYSLNAKSSEDNAKLSEKNAQTHSESAERFSEIASTASQNAENSKDSANTYANNAKASASAAKLSETNASKSETATAGYAQTAKTNADSTAADRQAVQTLAEQVTADKATVAENAAKVAEDRTAAETAAQTAQAVTDSLPDDYTTAVEKIAENTAEIGRIKLTDKELQRRVNALYDLGNGVTHQFETDSDTAYAKTVPTGAKLMSVKSVGGKSLVWNQLYNVYKYGDYTLNCKPIFKSHKYLLKVHYTVLKDVRAYLYFRDVMYTAATNRQIVRDLTAGSGKISWITSPLGEHSAGGEFGVFIVVDNSDGSKKFDTSPFSNHEIFDLTAMFGSGNEPSTVEEFEKMFPADYYPYNAGEIVSAGTEEIVEQGKNVWNLEGYTDSDLVDLKTGYWGVKLNVKPNSTYCISVTRDTELSGTYGKLIGADKRNIEFFGHKEASPLNAYTGHPITFQTADEDYVYVVINSFNGFDTWKSDFLKYFPSFQIEKSSTATAYAPYHSNVYQIPDTIKALPGYGWSAGTARNYVDYENKKYYKCVDSVDLGTVNWVAGNSGKVSFQTSQVTGQKLTKSYSIAPNFMCLKYSTKTQDELWGKPNVTGISANANTDGYIYVNDTSYTDAAAFKQAMSGVILYYELANPIITDISSLIPDDFLRNIEVEAWGSVTFKNSNDNYHIPVPSEEEYIVKLSEVGGTT